MKINTFSDKYDLKQPGTVSVINCTEGSAEVQQDRHTNQPTVQRQGFHMRRELSFTFSNGLELPNPKMRRCPCESVQAKL